MTKILAHYNYDDILIGCNNLYQQIVWFENRYKRLNKPQKESLKHLYIENTYMNNIIEQINNEIKEEKRKKIMDKYKIEDN